MTKFKFIIEVAKITFHIKSRNNSLMELINLWASYKLDHHQDRMLPHGIEKLKYLKELIEAYLKGNRSLINKITENIRKNILNW
jgi:hypothetical protein